MITPLIHLNGTSREALSKQFKDVVVALRAALRAMDEAAPNGRDYYPIGDEAFETAQAQHRNRIERVRDVLANYETLWESVQED